MSASALCLLTGGPLDGAAIADPSQPESIRVGLGVESGDYPLTSGGAMRIRYFRPVPVPASVSALTYYRWSDGLYRPEPEPLPV